MNTFLALLDNNFDENKRTEFILSINDVTNKYPIYSVSRFISNKNPIQRINCFHQYLTFIHGFRFFGNLFKLTLNLIISNIISSYDIEDYIQIVKLLDEDDLIYILISTLQDRDIALSKQEISNDMGDKYRHYIYVILYNYHEYVGIQHLTAKISEDDDITDENKDHIMKAISEVISMTENNRKLNL